MTPILATTAASAAIDIVHNIADKITKGTAKTAPTSTPAVPFSTLIDNATAPTAASQAQRVQELSARLGKSAEVIAASNTAGASGPLNIQIESTGEASLKLANGSTQHIELSPEMRGVARELYQSRQSGLNTATMASGPRPVTITVA